MSKKEFEEMMSLAGIKPLKKSKKSVLKKKKIQKNSNEKSFEELMAEDEIYQKNIYKPEETYEDESEKSFEELINLESVENKEKKRKESINFEDALNLYAPEDSNNINKKNSKEYKVIFKKTYSNISLDDISHKIDLHGLNTEEAKAKVKYEITFCKQARFKTLLVVTGKGNHSKNGAVIKIAIEKMLLSLPKIIEMLEYAPIQAGGDGAFIVSLR